MHVTSLLRISFAATLRRLRHDLATEIVVTICVAVLLGTFFYVFDDFINTQVASLSTPMKNSLSEWFARIVILTCGVWGGSGFARERRDPDALHAVAVRIGEFPAVARAYLTGRRLLWFILFVGGAWGLLARFFPPQEPAAAALRILFALAGWTVGRLTGSSGHTTYSGTGSLSGRLSSLAVAHPMIRALIRWRLLQIFRNRATKSLLGVAGGFFLLAALTALRKGPDFAVVLCGFAGGFCAAATLPVQVQNDLLNAWIERSSGVSHDQYMQAIRRIAILLGVMAGAASGVLVLAAQATVDSPVKTALQVAAVSAVPAWSMPAIIFQIDARRSAATLLAALIVTLFLATAVYAHWLSLLLLPLMSWYADNMQARRFHRA